MRARLGPTVVVGLAGAGLAAVSSAQVWGRGEVALPAARMVEARGTDVAPIALPLALVALAAWGAVLVLRRRGRRVVAVIGAAAGAGVVAAVLARAGDVSEALRDLAGGGAGGLSTDTTAWPWTAVVGGVVTALSFLVACLAAAHWPEMSARYDAPSGPPASSEGRSEAPSQPPAEEVGSGDLWRALDEGRDPTA